MCEFAVWGVVSSCREERCCVGFIVNVLNILQYDVSYLFVTDRNGCNEFIRLSYLNRAGNQ